MHRTVARLLQVLIPGAGHIARDRYGRGLVLFLLFLFFLNAAVFARWYPWDALPVRMVGAIGAVAVWIFAGVDARGGPGPGSAAAQPPP